MSIMLITYDHGKMNRAVDPVLGIIKRYNYVRLSENTYAIETCEKTRPILNKIKPHLRSDAHLFVVTLTKPFSSPVQAPMSDWFSKYLPEE